MHPECRDFVCQFTTDEEVSVVEIGSRNVNGGVRDLFPNAKYTGIDIRSGTGVDIVCSAMAFNPESPVDLVICTEVLEHAREWKDILTCAALWLRKDGRIIVTCAGMQRRPHSGVDGGRLRRGEWYENRSAMDLIEVMHQIYVDTVVETGQDVQVSGVRK